MADGVQYPDHFVIRLETLWGDGFLSPGGPEEVREITRGIDLAGKTVLDIGCGTGGPAIVLAREMGAARIVAVDVEAHLLERAAIHAKTAGVDDRIEFRPVAPGPLPFDAETFDAVFSKDALIHIFDKQAIYREVLRVLRPGGVFLASDWLGGENTATSPEWAQFRAIAHLDFTMATATETEATMRAAGFERVATRDRNEWFVGISRQEADQVAGPLREQLIEAVGEEIYSDWLAVRRVMADAVAVGALRPTHLRAHKPG